MGKGFLLAAPHSGSGKTTITLGLLRALKQAGHTVRPFKAGPDFIDPQFHAKACGVECINLDPWGMRRDYLRTLFNQREEPAVVEAMMGLFDGAADGSGSAADLAFLLDLPVVLVVDCAKQSHSIAALVAGYRSFKRGVLIKGVILNKVGSARHEAMLREALNAIDMPVFGVVMRDDKLVLPSRHLGLVQAQEHAELESFLDHAGLVIGQSLDVEGLRHLSFSKRGFDETLGLPPLGQRIAVANDQAFAFAYPHLLRSWREQGASVSLFSPLADEAPEPGCDAVFLPGGYPELYAGKLAAHSRFLEGVRNAAASGSFVYGECGGFMVLGHGLVDAKGQRHQMAGLLPLVTSFEQRRLHLGYRNARVMSQLPFAMKGSLLACHEYHYSTIVEEGSAQQLFDCEDARGEALGFCGLHAGNVAGSYMHVIDHRLADS